MARPWKHPKTGVYHLRRRVPADLVKLVGREIEKRSLGTKDPTEARARHFAATMEVEERWANLRKGNQPLSNRQVQALAGEIYSRKVAEHADDPGAPEEWRRRTLADRSLQGLRKLSAGKPSALRLATGWSEAEAVVRSRHGDDVDRFIANKGLIVSEADHRRIVLAAAEASALANESLLRNAEGDYTPDRKAERFPEPFAAAGALKLDVLWIEYRRSLQPSEATVKRWYPILTKFMAFVGTEDIRRVTTADVIRWRDKMLDEAMDLSPLTVRDVYLAAPKALFGFAVSQSRIGSNPAAGVVVRVKKKKKLRKSGFSSEEADLILSASLAPQNGLASRELKDARRWVPWLCAYSGARVNEITQLRVQDVKRSEGVWVMNITPEAGNTKTGPREVPLHDHLVEQGFLDFVRSKKAGPLFYSVARQRGASAGNPTYVKVGGKLAEWVRAVGVDDENVQPNHGWRHRFKTIGRAVGIDSARLDAIQGHAPATEGDKYGEFLPNALKLEVDKIPRYEVVAGAAIDRRRKSVTAKASDGLLAVAEDEGPT
ncbi:MULTISPECIES: DUF6538 domain-containing protein [unclassified Methylobacterium]|uniref:DUF6538 domain-containing protein n=1 Tax=unclassified Methylobacterium TaxID=2615210 RepID=UPI0011C1F142|nr:MULTISPECIES: DUF6538 domain-containing protein [unclassified Methylobacterium]QEE41039.1 tyrosine-type recombinase/integrase [Methylobacterium sp. WL1]TXN58886.1 tyrosine-type recombinase/integrase [Methylobacterium sp. WL2]